MYWAKGAVRETAGAASNVILKRARKQLEEYFAGKRREFDLPLVVEGTEFQRGAWKQLTRIPFGKRFFVSTGSRFGRFAFSSRSRNMKPVAIHTIVVPLCHRVVGKSGALTGYAAGLKSKRFLLDHERALAGAPEAR